MVLLINNGFVDFLQDIKPLGNFTKHCMDAIQVVQIFAKGQEELER
jgi:hypothetical protein